jgi:hypothetical protein
MTPEHNGVSNEKERRQRVFLCVDNSVADDERWIWFCRRLEVEIAFSRRFDLFGLLRLDVNDLIHC